MKKGLIIINAYSKLQSATNQATRLKQEFSMLNVDIDIKCNDFFACEIKDNAIKSNVLDYDFCIYLDKDKYVSKMLEMSGMRLFNSHQAVQDCDDKFATYLKLIGSGLNLVDTMSGLLCYTKEEPIKESTVLEIEKRFSYPIVIKESFGSLGKGIHKADNRAQLIKIMEEVKMQPHLFQEMVKSSYGKDVRVIVIGGKVVASMLRKSDKDFRSNIELGGTGEKIELSKEFSEAAIKCAKVLNLDYCGVDLLFGKEGEPIVCEVNSNAFFGGIEKVSGVNVAKEYAEYIYEKIYK